MSELSSKGLSRRDFLKVTAMAGAGLFLPNTKSSSREQPGQAPALVPDKHPASLVTEIPQDQQDTTAQSVTPDSKERPTPKIKIPEDKINRFIKEQKGTLKGDYVTCIFSGTPDGDIRSIIVVVNTPDGYHEQRYSPDFTKTGDLTPYDKNKKPYSSEGAESLSRMSLPENEEDPQFNMPLYARKPEQIIDRNSADYATLFALYDTGAFDPAKHGVSGEIVVTNEVSHAIEAMPDFFWFGELGDEPSKLNTFVYEGRHYVVQLATAILGDRRWGEPNTACVYAISSKNLNATELNGDAHHLQIRYVGRGPINSPDPTVNPIDWASKPNQELTMPIRALHKTFIPQVTVSSQ